MFHRQFHGISQSAFGKLSLVGAFSLAGSSVVAGAYLTPQLGGFTIAALSLCVAVLGLLPAYGRKAFAALRGLTAQDYRLLVLQALFGSLLFRVFLLLGLSLASAVTVGMLLGATPAITALLAALLLREKPTRAAVLGIALSVTGIVLLQGVATDGAPLGARHFWGGVLALCASASEATFTVLSRKHRRAGSPGDRPALHPMVQTLMVSVLALLLCAVPAVLEHPLAAIESLTLKGWLALGWYGLFVTALAYVCFYAGVRRCDGYTVAAYTGMMPLISMLLSLLFLGETVSGLQLAGGALIIAGMVALGRHAAGIQKANAPEPEIGLRGSLKS